MDLNDIHSMAVGRNIPFRKMQGCGNDFVVVRNPGLPLETWAGLSRSICCAHFGVGSDGMMILNSFNGLDRPVDVWMINPDGSNMGMCGNGIRCLTRFLALEGLVTQDSFGVDFNVGGRRIFCETIDRGASVTVNMGIPSFSPDDIALDSDSSIVDHELEILDRVFRITCVSMGNPHCVIPVKSVEDVDLDKYGPAIEKYPLFLKRTNVEFVERLSDSELRVLVWERGAGRTLACGTGACATTVAMNRLGKCSSGAVIHLPGGDISVKLKGEGMPVMMTGPAVEVFSGSIVV